MSFVQTLPILRRMKKAAKNEESLLCSMLCSHSNTSAQSMDENNAATSQFIGWYKIAEVPAKHLDGSFLFKYN